jgi:hypothetical protein
MFDDSARPRIRQNRQAEGDRGTDRLEPEFLLAPPAHPDRLSRPAKRDDRRIGRGIVGAIMAIAARTLDVLDRNCRRIELQSPRQRIAQRVHALRMGPHRESSVAIGRAGRTARPRRGRYASGYTSPIGGGPPLKDPVGRGQTVRSIEGCCKSQRASSWNGLIASTPSQVT